MEACLPEQGSQQSFTHSQLSQSLKNTGRGKRQVRAPRRLVEEYVLDGEFGKDLSISNLDTTQRPLTPADIALSLTKRTVFVHWPADGKWYKAQVKKVRVKDQTAKVYYTDTGDEEVVDLSSLIEAGEISLVEQQALPVSSSEAVGPSVGDNPPTMEVQPESAPEDACGDDEMDQPIADLVKEVEERPLEPLRSAKRAKVEDQSGGGQNPETSAEAGHGAELSVEADDQNQGGQDLSKGSRKDEDGTAAWDLDDASAAEEWSKSVLANLVRKSSGSAQGAAGIKRQGSGPHTPSRDVDVRGKVRTALKDSLLKAAAEAQGEDETAGADSHADELAVAVEKELFELYGSVGKEYRSKYRSLHFNLKDPHNPQLRGKVFAGDIPPRELVRMSALELASKELSEWRTRKAAEFEKAVILDTFTAAKYSTAAAAEIRQHLAKGQESEQPDNIPSFVQNNDSATDYKQEDPPEDHDHGTNPGDMPLPPLESDSPGARTSTKVASMDQYLGSVGPFGEEEGDIPADGPGPSPCEEAGNRREGTSPSPCPSPSMSPTPEPEVEDFGSIILAPESEDGTSGMPWEGRIEVPGMGVMDSCIEQIAGAGRLRALLPSSGFEIKGRVSNAKLEPFFWDLNKSRTRTVTIGRMRCPHSAELLNELIQLYGSRGRSGVAEPTPGLEVYFVPRSPLSAKFCATARKSAAPGPKGAIPADISSGEMLCVTVHRKDWQSDERKGSSDDAAAHGSASEQEADLHEYSPPPESPVADRGPQQDADGEAVPSFLSALEEAEGQEEPGASEPEPSPQKRDDDPSATPDAAAPANSQGPHGVGGLDLNNLGALAVALGVDLQKQGSEPASTQGRAVPGAVPGGQPAPANPMLAQSTGNQDAQPLEDMQIDQEISRAGLSGPNPAVALPQFPGPHAPLPQFPTASIGARGCDVPFQSDFQRFGADQYRLPAGSALAATGLQPRPMFSSTNPNQQTDNNFLNSSSGMGGVGWAAQSGPVCAPQQDAAAGHGWIVEPPRQPVAVTSFPSAPPPPMPHMIPPGPMGPMRHSLAKQAGGAMYMSRGPPVGAHRGRGRKRNKSSRWNHDRAGWGRGWQ
uniref:Phd finger n=1 Tax=Tetraselmis sp. GSL018 TaxID=582737 RepID=A0A061RWJ1_9CHLO